VNKTIEVIISPKGETRIETKGFSGPGCLLASEFVEQALGRRTSEQRKGEFYDSQKACQDLRQSS